MSDGIADGNREPDIVDMLESWLYSDEDWAQKAAKEIKQLRAWRLGDASRIATLERQLEELNSGKVWVVEITYRDGQVMRTIPLTKQHADEHCENLLSISTVARAAIVGATADDLSKMKKVKYG